MELKEFRKAFCAAMKEDIKNLYKEQKILKQQRKLAHRPADKQLWEIQYQINENAGKINTLIRFYRWTKHNMNYWNKRGVTYYNDFLFDWNNDSIEDDSDIVWYYIKYNDQRVVSYTSRWMFRMQYTINRYIEYCKKYDVQFTIPLLQQIVLNVR